MNRFFYGFLALMMASTYCLTLIIQGRFVPGLWYFLLATFLGFTTYFGLARFEAELFAVFSVAQLAVVYYLTLDLRSITGGDSGLDVVVLDDYSHIWRRQLLVCILCLASILIARLLVSSPLAKLLTAYGDDALMFRCLGSIYCKSLAVATLILFVSAGLLGVLFTVAFSRVDPRNFSIDEAFNLTILGVIAGRAGTWAAAGVPFAFLLAKPIIGHQFNQPLYFSALLQLCMIFILLMRPQGIAGRTFSDRV